MSSFCKGLCACMPLLGKGLCVCMLLSGRYKSHCKCTTFYQYQPESHIQTHKAWPKKKTLPKSDLQGQKVTHKHTNPCQKKKLLPKSDMQVHTPLPKSGDIQAHKPFFFFFSGDIQAHKSFFFFSGDIQAHKPFF